MTWLAWTAIGIGGWLLLAVLICGMFALGKRRTGGWPKR
jgi:hypothetical protein